MQFRNTIWFITPNTAGFAALSVFCLEQNFISLLPSLHQRITDVPRWPPALSIQSTLTQVGYKYCLHVLLQFLLASQYTDGLVTTALTSAIRAPAELSICGSKC